ncbi:hypothetical protein NLG97_g4631 [Lecanicillium saksenae]|uniref:Uncharacterized protein n=1 Tax=Lecanicillium saksenae TaxID=468837 RepID=A0ACC1QWG2_9HYPO|nr:hypothetical protein NLG97_g4631 [Lecanicillium saksenae]
MSPPTSRTNGRLVDTIYCEAKCSDEDVYYFGSDDDQYENPRERKRRYERAGQRFLEGSTPRLFSASLRGPFDTSRGWKNPWASKTLATRTVQRPQPEIAQSTKHNIPTKPTNRHVRLQTQQPRLGKPECHLPSPQSLKTASLVSDAHPFLEDEELRAVQAWRHSVGTTAPDTEAQSIAASTAAAASRKRKASHNWLKTVPDKRNKTERTGRSIEQPEPYTPTLPVTTQSNVEVATTANAAALQLSSKLPPRKSTAQLISPSKQSLATKNITNPTARSKNELPNSLRREQQAAATLSSPVSLQNVKQEHHTTQPSPLKFKAKIHSISDASSDRSDTKSRNTTALRQTITNEIIRTPHRVSDDEDFIFDIALDPLSDSSESESEDESEDAGVEVGQEAVGSTELIPAAHQTLSAQEEMNTGDSSSDSDLTELSESPVLSDWEGAADEAGAESEEAQDRVEEGSDEVTPDPELAVANADATVEAMDMSEDVPATQPVEVQVVTESEEMPTVEAGPVGELGPTNDGNENMVTAAPHQAKEQTSTSDEQESRPSEMNNGQLTLQNVADAKDEPQVGGDNPGPIVEAEAVESEICVTATPASQSAAASAVPPSPKIKQESSEFSLKAMFRSFVPTNTWTQLTGLASASTQPTTQHSVDNPMDEHVLPSIEVPLDQDDGRAIDVGRSSQVDETAVVPSIDRLSSGADESQLQLLSEHDHALASDSLPAPQQPTNECVTRVSQEEPAAVERDEGCLAGEPLSAGEAVIVDDVQAQEVSPKEPPTARVATASELMPPPKVPAATARLVTPSPTEKGDNSEPRFAFKSFAAFTTPSPERLRVKKRRTLPGSSLRHPSLKGILSSRKAGATPRTRNRVSWFLPGEQDADTTDSQEDKASLPTAPSSPPPRTPLAELPTASNEKFSKHFSSVLKRTDGLRHRFHVARDTDGMVEGLSSSQCTSSQSSYTMTRSNVDTMMKDAPVVASSDIENQGRPREATMSVEPMDMVEDMVREMGDFWQAWDVDAELNAAKKAQAETATTGSQPQNSWR